MDWIQWAVLACAGALVVAPRLGPVATWANGLFAKAGVEPEPDDAPLDIHDIVCAYQILACCLPPELAQQVWVEIGKGGVPCVQK